VMIQYNKLDREKEAMIYTIPNGGMVKQEDESPRELQLMLRQIGSDLGGLSDEENP